eukprot:376501_1
MNSIGSSGNLMQQVTACSDNDYDNDEIIEWKEYRHNLKNIFQFFAGYKVNEIKKKQLKKLLAILDMKQYWNVYLMDDISMDQFITYLCKPDVNPQISDIKNHLEAKPQWVLVLKVVKCLEDIDNSKKRNGLLELTDFKTFGENMQLNDLEIQILFEKLDKDKTGQITIDQVYQWFQKKMLKK